MGKSAKILFVDILDALRAAVLRYREQATNALISADAEVRRNLDELKEKAKYWTMEIRVRQEEVSRARSALSFARSMHDGKNVGTSEQEIQLKKAKERLQEAEEKLKMVRRWQGILPDHVREYETRVRQLSGFLETELPKGAAFLTGRADALAKYLATIAPSFDAPPPSSASEVPPP